MDLVVWCSRAGDKLESVVALDVVSEEPSASIVHIC